jgi:hypothetical protein
VGGGSKPSNLALVPVESTLVDVDGLRGPEVWAVLPARWLSASGIAGPQVPSADVTDARLSKWQSLCDYNRYDHSAFLSLVQNPDVWLYDRGTIFYRGYARLGALSTLQSAYRETAYYRSRITGSGTSTRVSIPNRESDLKYNYAQNLALHYLFTGDDRFRERAEDMATRAKQLWPNPGYSGGSGFWTERHAGFALLAYVWAAMVSDDRQAHFQSLADEAVDAYLQVQRTYPVGYTDNTARCFAHSAVAHGESGSYFGCSPWMSAILADGLDAYATERGGTRSEAARDSIVKLGRILARRGRDSGGKPYYMMAVNNTSHERDPYDEHWGEPAYVVAMAWHHGGRTETALRDAAFELARGFRDNGVAPHMRSFNWQCRSAVATPYYLKE